MAESQFLRNIEVMTHRQNTSGCHDALIAHHHGSIMKRRILEENILYQPLVNLGVYLLTRIHDVLQWNASLYNDKSTYVFLRHTHTRHHNRHDGLLVSLLLALLAGVEEPNQPAHTFLRTYLIEESTDILLEDDDEGDDSHAHQFIQDRTQQAHFQYLTHKEPDKYEKHDAHEDVQ